MPFVIRHTPVGVLGRLAVKAGQARGQQLQMGRDLQLTSMALAAQSRAEQTAAASRNRAFALQRAGANEFARQRPAKPETIDQRRFLNKAVAEANAAGIYEPNQIKQAEIFANLGDTESVRKILGKLPQPTERRRELQTQADVVGAIAQKNIDVVQRRLDSVTDTLNERFNPGMQKVLREDEKIMGTVSPEVQELFAQQDRLGKEIEGIQQGAAQRQEALSLGLSVPQQIALGAREQTRLTRAEAAEQRRIDKQLASADKLSSMQRAAITTERQHAREIRSDIDREITLLRREFGQYEDESEDDYAIREQSIRNQIGELEGKKMNSYTEERGAITKIVDQTTGKPGKPNYVKGRIYTNAAGKRIRFLGFSENGRPQGEVVD